MVKIKKANDGYRSKQVFRSPDGMYKTVIKEKERGGVKKKSLREVRTLKGRIKGAPKKYEREEAPLFINQEPPIETKNARNGSKTPAWQRSEGKNPSGGLNAKGVASYRRQNPGSKLKTAVTTKPSKLKAGSKSDKRRKSFCARMSGMKKRLTSAKTANDPNSRINKSLRKWNC